MTTLKEPLVSIGMPVYNAEISIAQALDGVLSQTYRNLELIVSDNASTDRTAEICLHYARKDSRVKYHRNPTNIGLLPNFRQAFELSSGDYFMWAAADDIRPATAVEECVRALLNSKDSVLAHGPVLVVVKDGTELIERANSVDVSASRAGYRVRAFTKGVKHNGILYGLYSRPALANVVLADCCGQDYLLCLQICLLGKLEYVQNPIIIYRERGLVASDDPMYRNEPLSLSNLLQVGGLRTYKCWTVLLMGSYYLAKMHNVSLLDRSDAIIYHAGTFVARYRLRLMKELIYQLFRPAAWACSRAWGVLRQRRLTSNLAHKLRAVLKP